KIGTDRLEGTAKFRITARLWIERIHLAQPALQEQMDDRNVFFALRAQDIAPREESPRKNRADFQKSAAIKVFHNASLLALLERVEKLRHPLADARGSETRLRDCKQLQSRDRKGAVAVAGFSTSS